VTAGNHRAELAERYDAIAAEESFGDGATAELDAVVARVTRAVESDDAPEGEGLTTTDAITESFVLIESDPEAVPTFGGGIAVANGIPEGDHRLTVNGAGRRPTARSWRSRRTSPLRPPASTARFHSSLARTRRRWSCRTPKATST